MAWSDTQDQRLIKSAQRAVKHALANPRKLLMKYLANDCGSLFCIGGWMAVISDPSILTKPRLSSFDTYSARVAHWLTDNMIFISTVGKDPWSRLFIHEKWPRQFSKKSQLRERFAYWLETGK